MGGKEACPRPHSQAATDLLTAKKAAREASEMWMVRRRDSEVWAAWSRRGRPARPAFGATPAKPMSRQRSLVSMLRGTGLWGEEALEAVSKKGRDQA